MMEQMMKQMMEQMPFGKMPSFGEMPFGKMPSLGEMPFGKMPSFEEMPFGKMPSFGEMPFGKMQGGNQMMDFIKPMLSNMVNAMDMMHEQNEKMMEMFLDNLPEQGKEPIKNLIETAQKGHNELKKLFDDNIKKMEGVFGAAEKAKPTTAKKTKK